MFFRNPESSHEHSLEILNVIYGYDSFLDSLRVIADMGCGGGLDSKWFAELWTRDEPPEPRNYTVYAVDQNIKQIEPENTMLLVIPEKLDHRVLINESKEDVFPPTKPFFPLN